MHTNLGAITMARRRKKRREKKELANYVSPICANNANTVNTSKEPTRESIIISKMVFDTSTSYALMPLPIINFNLMPLLPNNNNKNNKVRT